MTPMKLAVGFASRKPVGDPLGSSEMPDLFCQSSFD
jgi:hypothetical protein